MENRQVICCQNFVAVEVGDGYFCGGNQPQVIVFALKTFFGKFGQLTRGGQGLSIHQERRQDFGIACGSLAIEHEGNQRTFQGGSGSQQHDKAALSNFGGAIAVQNA